MVDKRRFKDVEVSLLGLGTMRLPCETEQKRESNPNIDYEKAQKLVDLAYKNGVNYYDTAYMYHCGKSEKFIGHALKKYPRNTYFIADKLPIWMCDTKEDMQRVFANQLERTGMEYFDFYLLHSLDKENFEKCEKLGAYDFIKQKQKEGKIKYIGFSFHGTVDDLRHIVSAHDWDFAQIQMNYLDWENQNAKMQYQILEDADIPTIVMEPVRGGKLALVNNEIKDMFKSKKPIMSVASWAMGFVASHKNIITILSGMNSEQQMLDNLSTLTNFKAFGDDEYSICFKAASILNKSEVIGCTGCDYCQPCPKGIKISSFFSLYNSVVSGDVNIQQGREVYDSFAVNPTACAWCNKCKNHCPQSISVPDVLEGKVIKLFMR
jgi:predicted aldo/keto reductase-like oxidoreductase